jgi:hypothetical protein
MGGGPQDVIESQVAEEEVAEEVAPGEEVATFLSDFNRGMSASSPEEELSSKIDSLQNQAAQLQAQAAGGHPDWGMSGPAVPMSAEQAAATASGGGQGWNNPNTVQGQLDILSGKMDRLENLSMGLQSVQKGYPQPNMSVADYDAYSRSPAAWQNPNTAYTPLESPNYPAWENPNTAYTPLESPNYPAWQNPNTVRPPLEGANFPPDWYNVNEQIAYPTAMGGNLPPISAQEAAATATGGGQGWVNPNASFEELEAQFSTSPQVSPQVGGGVGWVNPNATFEELEAQFSTSPEEAYADPSVLADAMEGQLAPKYSPQTVGYQTHEQMYPNHRNAAAMAGVASIKAQFDGSHKAWIDAINQDMKDRGIELTHEIYGVKTGKHSSADWKEYDALFTVGEDGVPRDSNGVAMPGTERQAQAGLGGVLQGLWGGVLSGAEKLFQPSTSSGVDASVPDLGYPTHASGNIPANIATGPDDIEGPGGTMGEVVDLIRNTYSWAPSLPNSVLWNAARYPDYLRLLIEADAAGTELPLVVPDWILAGEPKPPTNTTTNTNTNTDTNNNGWIRNHPAMQVQRPPSGWGDAPWLS